MFEKANPLSAALSPAPGGPRRASADAGRRFEGRGARRAGEALRALEWSEITARLKAARDLRLLLRSDTQAPIEAVAASFGDAAASYFALLDDCEPRVNLDALERSKGLGAMCADSEANRAEERAGDASVTRRSDAKEVQ